jgi:hypothetical protein
MPVLTKEYLDSKVVGDLRKIAKKWGIKNYSKLKKAEMIKLIMKDPSNKSTELVVREIEVASPKVKKAPKKAASKPKSSPKKAVKKSPKKDVKKATSSPKKRARKSSPKKKQEPGILDRIVNFFKPASEPKTKKSPAKKSTPKKKKQEEVKKSTPKKKKQQEVKKSTPKKKKQEEVKKSTPKKKKQEEVKKSTPKKKKQPVVLDIPKIEGPIVIEKLSPTPSTPPQIAKKAGKRVSKKGRKPKNVVKSQEKPLATKLDQPIVIEKLEMPKRKSTTKKKTLATKPKSISIEQVVAKNLKNPPKLGKPVEIVEIVPPKEQPRPVAKPNNPTVAISSKEKFLKEKLGKLREERLAEKNKTGIKKAKKKGSSSEKSAETVRASRTPSKVAKKKTVQIATKNGKKQSIIY